MTDEEADKLVEETVAQISARGPVADPAALLFHTYERLKRLEKTVKAIESMLLMHMRGNGH